MFVLFAFSSYNAIGKEEIMSVSVRRWKSNQPLRLERLGKGSVVAGRQRIDCVRSDGNHILDEPNCGQPGRILFGGIAMFTLRLLQFRRSREIIKHLTRALNYIRTGSGSDLVVSVPLNR